MSHADINKVAYDRFFATISEAYPKATKDSHILARFTLGSQTNSDSSPEKPGSTCTVCTQSENKPR